MPLERVNDPRAFRDFLDARLANGSEGQSLDELLALWQYENAPDAEKDETRRAIRRGLEDMHAGRTRPFEQFDREFRARHSLPPRR